MNWLLKPKLGAELAVKPCL